MNLSDSYGRGVIMARACVWRPERTSYDALDTLQCAMLRKMIEVPREPSDDDAAYSIRVNRAIGRIDRVPWSFVAARAAVTWTSHLLRHPEAPASSAFRTQNHAWLEERRAEYSSTAINAVSRTGTRSERGAVIRWDGSGWVTTCGVTADDSPGAIHRATLKLLEHLKVKTTRAPPAGGGGFL